MNYEVRVMIGPRAGIRDPEGTEIMRALPALGYDNVSQVGTGKVIRLVIDAVDAPAAHAQADEMCRRFLSNPVIEDFTLELTELVP